MRHFIVFSHEKKQQGYQLPRLIQFHSDLTPLVFFSPSTQALFSENKIKEMPSIAPYTFNSSE